MTGGAGTPPGEERARDAAGDPALAAAKTRDAALVLPLLGLGLFTPPVIALFGAGPGLFGAPAVVVYLFAVWAGLIIAARGLSRRLRRGPEG